MEEKINALALELVLVVFKFKYNILIRSQKKTSCEFDLECFSIICIQKVLIVSTLCFLLMSLANLFTSS